MRGVPHIQAIFREKEAMMANNALLDEVLSFIDLNRELWDQRDWGQLIVNGWSTDELKRYVAEDPDNPACGSAMCFAGWACALSGFKPVFKDPSQYRGSFYSTNTIMCKDQHGFSYQIDEKARELLGIDVRAAGKLFEGGNSFETLQAMVEHLKEHGNLNDYPDDYSDDGYSDEYDEEDYDQDEPF